MLGAAEASRGWEAVLPVTGLDHVQQHGPSGAGIWSSPTVDEQLGVLYVATGDNYPDPPTSTSDAILAMDLKTGALLWSKQLTENDAFNTARTVPRLRTAPRRKGPISIWAAAHPGELRR